MEPVPLSTNRGGDMKTNWQHQKDAITTDQKNRVDDEHIHEMDKRRVKETETEEAVEVPRQQRKAGD